MSAADAAPEPPPAPPLGVWGRLWRIGAAFAIGLTGWLLTAYDLDTLGLVGRAPYGALLALDLLLVAPAVHVALWWHRRLPLWLVLLVQLLSGVFVMASGASLLLVASVSTRRRWREILPCALTTAAASVVYAQVYPSTSPTPWWVQLAVALVGLAAVVAWGLYVGARRELVAQWRWRAENADAQRAREAAAATAAERARIAREMHDVLAHRLTQVSMHAGVLSYRTDLTPEQVRAEAETIRSASAAALDDLRGILGVLRAQGDADDPVAPPQPSLADLPALVEEARAAGTRVEVDDALATPVPERLGRHAYRIVQEGLTNARRHAPGAPVRVALRGRPGGELQVAVTNEAARLPGPADHGGSGLGLVGLRERAAIVGGALDAAPDGDGWRLAARLPWPHDEEVTP